MKFLQRIGLFFCFMLFAGYTQAQCAMCQATAESSLESGSTAAAGLNKGVLYLLVMPVIFAVIFLVIYFKRQRELKQYEEYTNV